MMNSPVELLAFDEASGWRFELPVAEWAKAALLSDTRPHVSTVPRSGWAVVHQLIKLEPFSKAERGRGFSS